MATSQVGFQVIEYAGYPMNRVDVYNLALLDGLDHVGADQLAFAPWQQTIHGVKAWTLNAVIADLAALEASHTYSGA